MDYEKEIGRLKKKVNDLEESVYSDGIMFALMIFTAYATAISVLFDKSKWVHNYYRWIGFIFSCITGVVSLVRKFNGQ